MARPMPALYAGRTRRAENINGYLFILPAMLVIGVFFIWPAGRLFDLSLQNFNMMSGKGTYVGFQNFARAFSDPDFLNSLGITGLMALFIVPVQGIIALVMAVFINQKIRGVNLFRTIYFLPAVIAFVAVAVIWKQMYSTTFGLVNAVFEAVGLPRGEFLSSKSQALISVVVTCIWKSWGYYMVIFLSGLQDIPAEIREAAKIDGASPVREFFHITFPMVSKVTLFVVIITTMDALKLFIPISIMTAGGPAGVTNTAVYHIWRNAFRLNKVGYAAAMSAILFVVIVVITIIQFKVGGKDEAQ